MPAYGTHCTLDVEGQEDETFAVVEFHHQESFSSLFTLNVTAASINPAISLDQLLESNATLTIFRDNIKQRSIRGIVTACEQGDTGKHQTLYTLNIRPPFWRSALRRNSRIFQNTDIEDIVSTLFDEMLVTQWQPQLSFDHPEREFCVQFREILGKQTWCPATLPKQQMDSLQTSVVTGPPRDEFSVTSTDGACEVYVGQVQPDRRQQFLLDTRLAGMGRGV
ncbi:contractile injection system protein, VgrG/Pvc8 family [Salmonella enterica]